MEEEKKAIERAKEILKEWQEIVDIEDIVEREIEMTLYAEDIPFNELKILVNLVEKLEKENKELKADNSHQWEERCKLTFQFEQLEKENEELDKAVGKMFRETQDSIPKSIIRDKFKRINETKIKTDKINARDYMIFGDTDRATGWFINVDYIEKILLDVPGYKIEEE